jgi:hypothetical protein
MYGLVNNSIEELVINKFGEDNWAKVLKRSQIGIDFFLSHESYDDEITFALAKAISIENNLPLTAVFHAFGEWWILKTAKERYGNLLQAGGENLKEFLINMPNFHNRVMLLYPKLTPPEFKVSDVTANSLNLHYFSKREGLADFVYGLIIGLSKLYDVSVKISLINSREKQHDHEVFNIIW